MRIINCTVTVRPTNGPPRTEVLRLVTSLLDHKSAPARQLAMIHHRRRETENSYAEIRNRLRGAGFILRSKLPEPVCQQVYALLTVYQARCALEVQAAEQAGIDPGHVSFIVTVRLVRLATTDQAAADTATLSTAQRQVTEDLLDALLPHPGTGAASIPEVLGRSRVSPAELMCP